MEYRSVHPMALPCLLDRLTDDNPGSSKEVEALLPWTRPNYYRDMVLRDLAWLLNTGLRTEETVRPGLEHLAASGFSFGIPALAGRVVGHDDLGSIRATIKLAIKRFEPRIDPESVEVVIATSSGQSRGNVLVFQISGRLWFKPSPIGFLVRTLMDLDRGDFRIDSSSMSGRGE